MADKETKPVECAVPKTQLEDWWDTLLKMSNGMLSVPIHGSHEEILSRAYDEMRHRSKMLFLEIDHVLNSDRA